MLIHPVMTDAVPVPPGGDAAARLRAALGSRCLVLVGLMGAGKTSVGRSLAARVELPFVDADVAIEEAAGMTIPEIFERHGEAYFRDGEKRVVARLLRDGPQVVATGGGAFMNAQTRARILDGHVAVWLRADLGVLMQRVRRRSNRPLLKNDNPEETMRRLMDERYPVYAQAPVVVQSREAPHEEIVDQVIAHALAYLGQKADDHVPS